MSSKRWKLLASLLPVGLATAYAAKTMEVMDHSQYSSDLAPSDAHRFGSLTEQLAGKRVLTGNDNKQAVNLLHRINTDFIHARIQVMVPL
jgi:hypothetical protein